VNLPLTTLLVLQSFLGLSQDQVEDLLYIRRLYLTKRGLLAMERNALMAETINDGCDKAIPTARESLDSLTDLASALQQNAMEDYQVYIKVAAAVRRGVSPSHANLNKHAENDSTYMYHLGLFNMKIMNDTAQFIDSCVHVMGPTRAAWPL